MEPVNINYVGGNNANYRLRGEPVNLSCKTLTGCRPDGDGWEEVWETTYGTERYRPQVKAGLPRKQMAARKAIPLATITIVPKLEVAPEPVVRARLAGKTEDELKIAALEAEIRKLMGLLK